MIDSSNLHVIHVRLTGLKFPTVDQDRALSYILVLYYLVSNISDTSPVSNDCLKNNPT